MNYTEDEIIEILKDESKTDEFLVTLTGEDLKRLLIYINSRVRNIPNEENDICRSTMYAGNLISPNNEIQNRYMDKIAKSLNNIEGRKNKATMMYYLINELHLFEDGNGRTSRAVFEMLTNKDFSFENNENLIHVPAEIEIDGNGESKIDIGEFARKNNITNVTMIELLANFYLYKAMIQKGTIPDTDQYTKKLAVHTGASKENINIVDSNIYPAVYIPDEIKQQLSQIQIQEFQNALADNNGSFITTSGLTMLMLFIKDNNAKLADFTYLDGQRFYFPVLDDEENVQSLKEWKKEDFFKVAEIYNLIKESMLDTILDFFEQPENFSIDGSLSVRESLTTKSNILEQDDISSIFELLRKTAKLNIDGTRTAQNLEQLEDLLKQISIQNDKIITTENVGRQVVTEMSNPTIEDEVEQAIIEENSIENMIENTEEEPNL